mmetsp:Transcript_14363/g.39935  ORF Transcript_14363/g.39935 Transcript_14363/m.39935 type:complete len:125 (+) Transcript_14363:2169-2543(+)
MPILVKRDCHAPSAGAGVVASEPTLAIVLEKRGESVADSVAPFWPMAFSAGTDDLNERTLEAMRGDIEACLLAFLGEKALVLRKMNNKRDTQRNMVMWLCSLLNGVARIFFRCGSTLLCCVPSP